MTCINVNHPDVQQLSNELFMHPAVIAAKIAVWQTKNNMVGYFPTGEELVNDQVVDKPSDDYFAPIPARKRTDVEIEKAADSEIIMTKKAKFEELGVSVPKKKISQQQIINLESVISRVNNELAKNGVPRNYSLNTKQVGQSDNFTWEVVVHRGKLDVEAKKNKAVEKTLEKNTVPSILAQGILQTFDYTDARNTEKNYSQEVIRKLAEGLSLQFGVDYAFIEPHDALEMTKNAKNPWRGQSAFFFNGNAYFISGQLKPSDVLHEFVHPIMKSILAQNMSLGVNLYNGMLNTPEGRKIIEDIKVLYPDLDENSIDFIEEALVRSLEKMQNLDGQNLEATPIFKNFVDKLLYSIKQFLRDKFGKKLRVSELSVNTTMKELSDILSEGTVFELDPMIITESDMVAYKNNYNDYMKGFVAEKADAKEIEDLANTYFDMVSKQLKSLQKANDLGELADIMSNKYKSGELETMKKNLKSYQTLIQQDAKKMTDDVELTRERTMAVINSLGNLNNMLGKIYEGLKDVVKDIDDQDNVQRVLYYNKVLNYWGDFMNTANTTLERNGVTGLKMVDSTNAALRKANDLVDDFYSKASKNLLWDKLKGAADNINRKWDERIASLKAQKAPAEIIAEAEAQYKREKITPQQIEDALKGKLKDLNFVNAYMEGYGYSPDPVVGGLALYVKDAITDVETKAQSRFNESALILKPLLDKVGYNPNDPGSIGERIGQKEKVGHVNTETGEFEEREVWRFANQFSGADLARDQYTFKIKQSSEKYKETGTEEDRKALADIQAEWENHRRKYFHNEYTEDFYTAYDILKKDALGKEASSRMSDLYDKLNRLSGQLSNAKSVDILDIADQIEGLRREIKQLSSLYDIAGNVKTGEDYEIAKRLQEFNQAIQPLYTSEEIPGAFETAYKAFEQKLMDEGKSSQDAADLLEKWKAKNTRIAIKDTFWDKISDITAAIKEIMSEIPQQEAFNAEIEEAYQVIKDMVKGNRDESGQPLGSELSPERQEKVKAAQEHINDIRSKLNTMSGLTKSEQEEIQAIMAKYQMGLKVSKDETLRLSQLLDKQAGLRLDKMQRAELNSLFAELDELRSKEATDSYIDTVNSFLDAASPDAVYEILNALNIDKDNAYLLMNDENVQKLSELSPEFEEWFKRNHTIKESVDWETKDKQISWERTYAWNVIKPKENKYYDKTTVTNLAGEKLTLDGLPSLKYFKRIVKDEFLTKKVEGQTVDNRGYWLPKTMAQGAADDRYINKDYERMRTAEPDLFNLVEAMKKIHLKNQEGLTKKGKLYLDMPRYRKQTAERLLSQNPVMRVIERIKSYWHNVKDRWDQGFNYDDNMQLVKMDLFDDSTTGIPIAGLSNLDIDEVSTDVVYTTMRYMLSAERNKALTELAPVARMVQNVVNNKKNYPLESKVLNNSTIVNMNKKKDKYLRAKAVNNFIERTFEGKINTGAGSESTLAQNFSQAIFGKASSAFLNFNIPSALKNAIGAKFQGLIESVAGKYMSPKDFIASEGWATATTFKISAEIYKQGPKSLDLQLVEIFDPERDRFNNHFGEAMTRTVTKDYTFLALNRMTDFRRWSQLQASLQIFAGMMKHQQIKTTDGKSIQYLDAWQVKDGKIQLKDNVPPEWGISYDKDGNQILGERFKQKRNEMQRVIDNLNGAMGKEDRPEADRYLLYRYLSFFRRFLTSMITNRFAYSGEFWGGTSRGRYDYTLGDTKEGWYITFAKMLGNAFRTGGKNLAYMKPEEKAAFMRLLTEAGTIAIMRWGLLPLLFGWDPDDKDRYAKLRAKSDALPLPGIYDDPNREFDMYGWLSTHVMLQFMQVAGENDQFLPLPGYGVNNYKEALDIKSMVFGPTVSTGFDIVKDLTYLATGDEREYYKKSAGPWGFQQEGEAKLWAHMAKAFGITGSVVDPARTVRNYQNVENK